MLDYQLLHEVIEVVNAFVSTLCETIHQYGCNIGG